MNAVYYEAVSPMYHDAIPSHAILNQPRKFDVRSVPIPIINDDELLIKGAFPRSSLTVFLILFQSHVAVSIFSLINAPRMDRILHRHMRD